MYLLKLKAINALHSNFEKTLKLLYALCHRMTGAIGLKPTTPGFGVMVNVVTPSIHST